MDIMPERTISATYAPELIPKRYNSGKRFIYVDRREDYIINNHELGNNGRAAYKPVA